MDLSREYHYLAVHCLCKGVNRRVDQQYGRALKLLRIRPARPDLDTYHRHFEASGYLEKSVAPSVFAPIEDVQILPFSFYYSDGETSLLLGRHRVLNLDNEEPLPDREKIYFEQPFDLVPRNQIASFIIGFWSNKYPLQALAHAAKST